jgi:hypothetical protein
VPQQRHGGLLRKDFHLDDLSALPKRSARADDGSEHDVAGDASNGCKAGKQVLDDAQVIGVIEHEKPGPRIIEAVEQPLHHQAHVLLVRSLRIERVVKVTLPEPAKCFVFRDSYHSLPSQPPPTHLAFVAPRTITAPGYLESYNPQYSKAVLLLPTPFVPLSATQRDTNDGAWPGTGGCGHRAFRSRTTAPPGSSAPKNCSARLMPGLCENRSADRSRLEALTLSLHLFSCWIRSS